MNDKATEPRVLCQRKLLELLRRSATGEGWKWLDDSLAEVRSSADPVESLLTLSAMARRKLGRSALEAGDQTLTIAAGTIALTAWELGDAGRAILVLEALSRLSPGEIVPQLYRAGDETERISITRALALFDDSSALKPVALETGRINSAALFSALALGNPYPAAHYTDHEFNQLVLKSLFMGLPVEHIVGLGKRANEELSRMCEAYYDERTAAGRAVPADIWLAMAPFASPRGAQLMRDHLQHEDARHRHYAAVAIGQQGQ